MKQALSKYGVGASEISTLAGLNPYDTPWSLWLRKTGQAPDIDETEAIEWGHRLEPAIRQAYADKTGAQMFVPPESMFHPDRLWARATPDAIVIQPDTDPMEWLHAVQIKNVGYWPGKDWHDGPPVYVQLQEMWEMDVTSLSRADVAALITGSTFRIYTVHRDDRLIADLVDIAAAFWRRVETRTPPKVDESDACRDHFTRRLARVGCVELVADEDLERTIAEWHQAREDEKRATKCVKTLRNRILSTMTDAQADRIISTLGVPKLARTTAKTHQDVNWKYVAEMLGNSDPETFQALVRAATTTTTTEPSVCLKEPREWSKESK